MILQVITDPDRRGAQVFALDLQAELRREGVEIETVALGAGTGSDDLPVVVLGPTRTSLKTFRVLVSRARRADVVVGHGSTTLFVGAVAATLARRPFVYRQISDSHFWADSWQRRLRVRAFLRAADAVVALWDRSAQTLVEDFGVDAAKITVIPNGVPPARVVSSARQSRFASDLRSGLAEDAVVAVYVGALAREKGADDAIRALPTEVDRLLVAGTGPDAARLQQIAADLAPGRVRFLGSVDDIASVYEAADLLVFPSRGGDSMPAAVIEAGLAGLPAVVSDTAALPTMVIGERTGLVVAVGDEAGLQQAISRLGRDRELRTRMGAEARQHCSERYSIRSVGEAWIQLLARFDRRCQPANAHQRTVAGSRHDE